MTIFTDFIITCPVGASDLVAEAVTTSSGAAKTQQGFIVDTKRKTGSKQKGKSIIMQLSKKNH